MYQNFRVPGSKAINHNVNKSLKFRIPYPIPYPQRLSYSKDPSWARCCLYYMLKTSFECQNAANHSSMWVTTHSFFGFPSLRNLTTLSLQYKRRSERNIDVVQYKFIARQPRQNKAPLCGRPTTHEDFTYPVTKCGNAWNSSRCLL